MTKSLTVEEFKSILTEKSYLLPVRPIKITIRMTKKIIFNEKKVFPFKK